MSALIWPKGAGTLLGVEYVRNPQPQLLVELRDLPDLPAQTVVLEVSDPDGDGDLDPVAYNVIVADCDGVERGSTDDLIPDEMFDDQVVVEEVWEALRQEWVRSGLSLTKPDSTLSEQSAAQL